MDFLANTFGYLLNFLYMFVQNYGLAIILFSIILKLLLLPLSMKQQRTMIKTGEIQSELKQIQFKYKGQPEKLNQETMALYKSKNMSPFSGCFSAIIQIVLLFAVFYLVKSPLTYMVKLDTETIDTYINQIKEEQPGKLNDTYPEISIIELKSAEDEKVAINMNFLGLDLSNIPNQHLTDPKVYIIPVLYVITSIISMKLTMNMQKANQKKNEVIVQDGENKTEKTDDVDIAAQSNKMMSYILPIMAVTISLVAPLGLALYWLVSNFLMIIERLALNKYLARENMKNNN